MRWLCILMVSLLATKSLAQELLFTSLPSKNRHLLFLIQGGQVESHDIHVQGWYCRYNGEAGLFLTRSDCLAGNVDNAIRVEFSTGWMQREVGKLDSWSNPRFIEVSGDFISWREHRPQQSAFIWGALTGQYVKDITPTAYKTIAEQKVRAAELKQYEEWDKRDAFIEERCDAREYNTIGVEWCDDSDNVVGIRSDELRKRKEARWQKLEQACRVSKDEAFIKEWCGFIAW